MKYPNKLEDAIALAEKAATTPYGINITLATQTAAEILRSKIYYHKKTFRRKNPDDDETPLARLVTSLVGSTINFVVPLPVEEDLDFKITSPPTDEIERYNIFRRFISRLLGKAPEEYIEKETQNLLLTLLTIKQLKDHIVSRGYIYPTIKIVKEEATAVEGESLLYNGKLIRYLSIWPDEEHPEAFCLSDLMAIFPVIGGRIEAAEMLFVNEEPYVSMTGVYKALVALTPSEAPHFYSKIESKFGR